MIYTREYSYAHLTGKSSNLATFILARDTDIINAALHMEITQWAKSPKNSLKECVFGDFAHWEIVSRMT